MESESYTYPEPQRRGSSGGQGGSGCSYVLVGLLTVFFAALIFLLGLLTGGGASIVDRVMTLLGRTPAAAPAPEIISGDAIIEQIRQVSRLETTIYTVERVIEVKQSDEFWPDWLRGDRLLLIASGTVVAGVDLERLDASSVTVSADGASVTVDLPPVEIFNRNNILDNARTRVYDRQQGLFAQPNANLETQARQAAESDILLAACEAGILAQANEDAQRALEKLLALYEFDVTVRAAAVPDCPEAP
jgi:hypothetical protein